MGFQLQDHKLKMKVWKVENRWKHLTGDYNFIWIWKNI